MKKIISLLAAASMSAFALVSCIKEDVKTTGETFTVNFLAQTPETKTIFGTPEGTTVPTLWEEGDNIAVICNFANDKKTAITTTDGKTASFSAEFPSIKEAESYTFYAAYPYVTSPYKSGKVKVSIPAVQAPVDGNIAKDAMGLVAKSEVFTAKPTEPVNLTFKHVSAYGCITKLDGVPAEANISSIKISSDNNIVGTFLSDCESTTLTEDLASKSLTINTNAHNNIWFSVAPFEGGNVTFEVLTDNGTYTVTKDFSGKAFTAGKIAKFGITGFEKSGAEDKVYTLVTSVDQLVEGANIIIAAKDEDYALSTTATTTANKNRKATTISRNTDGNIINPSEEVEILTLEKGYNEGTGIYALKTTTWSGYLAITTNANELKTEATVTTNTTWTITFNAENGAYIQNNAQTGRYLRYNPNNETPIFNGYNGTTISSTNKNVAIYIDQTSVLPALKAPEVIAIKNGTTIDVAWVDVENATEYVVSCTGQADQTVNAGVEEASFTNLSDGDYVVTVTAKADGFKSATGSAESIHIGLLARELAFETASLTVAPGELFSNTLTGKKIDDVVYTITNKDGSSVDENAVTIDANDGSGLAGDVEGEYIVKATAEATEEYAAGEASYTLKVAADTTPGTGDGTEASPYDADRAYAVAAELAADASIENVYVKGKISSITEVSTQYGNATYMISVDGTSTSNQIKIYRGLYLDGAKFTASNQIKVGDEVVVFGKLTNYKGNDYQMSQNNKLISINDKGVLKNRNLAYSPASATITVGDAWTAPTLSGDLTDATVSYVSSNTALATVSAEGTIALVADATGIATITATVAEDNTYAEATATYTITVKTASTGGEKTWKLVTDAATLKAGDQILFVSESAGMANGEMNSYTANSYFKQVTISELDKTAHSFGTTPSGSDIITLGGASGAWTFASAKSGKVIGCDTSGNNKLKSGSTTNTTWKITINASGLATILNNASSGDSKYLKYSSTNTRFSNYKSTSGAADFSIYRYE